MEIPRSLLDGYTKKINALSGAGQHLVSQALANAEWNSIAELRSIMSEVMNQVCSVVTDDASVVASEMYDDIRNQGIGAPLGKIASSSHDDEAIDGAVRALVQRVVKTGEVDTFGKCLKGRVDYEVKKAAGDAVLELCRRDPIKPRFARVPSGRETCSFCLMLASRGAVYLSKSTADAGHRRTRKVSGDAGNHYHANCDCRIVPVFDGQTIEGYDPDLLYRVWKRLDSAETISRSFYQGDVSSVVREAGEIDEQLRIAWSGFKSANRSAVDYRLTYGRVVASYSSIGDIMIDDFSKTQGKEVQLASWFSRNGNDVLIRNPDRSYALNGETNDFLIDGKTYEAKRIESSNPTKITKRITEKADRQGPRFIADLSISDIDRETAEMKIAYLLEDPRIDEILLVKSGTLKRFTK